MNNPKATEGKKDYLEEGRGEPIVLLYGLFGSVSNFRPLIDHLKESYRVIVPVFPFYDMGTGITIFSLTKFVDRLINELGLETFHLLGNSMGGHIALLYILEHPEKVKSLILSGSSGLYECGMGDSFPRRGDYNYIKAKTEQTFFNPQTATKELVDEIYATVNSRKALQILSLAKSTIHNNLEKELVRIKTGCCLIWGKNDCVTPPDVAQKFNRLIPGSELHWINACGHVPMLETPGEFNKILDGFLQPVAAKQFQQPVV